MMPKTLWRRGPHRLHARRGTPRPCALRSIHRSLRPTRQRERGTPPGAPLVLVLLCAALAPPSGNAEMSPEGLRLQEALENALRQNKELAAFRHRIGEQVGRLEQAGLLPNPEAIIEIEDVGGSGAFEGTRNAQTTFSLAWVLELGQRKRRVGVEHARARIISLDAEILRIAIAAETAQRFLDCLANQARLAAADGAVALAEEMIEVKHGVAGNTK